MTIDLYPLEDILPNPHQARQFEDPEAIRELARDILTNGLIQIPRGRPDPENPSGRVQLACGHERLAAYKLLAAGGIEGAGPSAWQLMPVDVGVLTERQMFEIGISENLKRRPLNAIEIGAAMRQYVESFHATWTEAGKLFGYTQSAVSNIIRLQNLNEPIKAMVEDRRLAERQARQLLAVQKIDGTKATAIAEKVAAAPVGDRDEVLHDELQKVLRPQNSRELGDRHFPLDWSDMSADIPSCMDCPLRIGDDVCPRPECFDRKLNAWLDRLIEEVVAATGIPARAPGESTHSIPFSSWDAQGAVIKQAMKEKLPFLRWMVVSENDPARADYREISKHWFIALGTVDQKAWGIYLKDGVERKEKRNRAAQRAEASDSPQEKKKHEKEIREMRREKGARIRNRYDSDWIVCRATEAIAEKLPISGDLLQYLVDRVEEFWWERQYCGGEVVPNYYEDLQEADMKATGAANKERLAREIFTLFLFGDADGGSTARKEIEDSFVELADGIGVKLPKGWNEPPIHRTKSNCWHCGRFASQEDKILQVEIEEGWGLVWQGENLLDVNCPDCKRKPIPASKPKPAAKKKSKK